MNAVLPVKFQTRNDSLHQPGGEWWTAFDNNLGTYWNSEVNPVPNYMFVTFDDEYLMTLMQLSVVVFTLILT